MTDIDKYTDKVRQSLRKTVDFLNKKKYGHILKSLELDEKLDELWKHLVALEEGLSIGTGLSHKELENIPSITFITETIGHYANEKISSEQAWDFLLIYFALKKE